MSDRQSLPAAATFDYYTNWSFIAFAVVMTAAYSRLAFASVRSILRPHAASAVVSSSTLLPPEIVVGVLVNSLMVGIGGQLLVTYGRIPEMDPESTIQSTRCVDVARQHMHTHVLPMWLSVISVLILPSLIQRQSYSSYIAAIVPVGMASIWIATPTKRERLRGVAKVQRLYGRLPLRTTALTVPLLAVVAICICRWRVR